MRRAAYYGLMIGWSGGDHERDKQQRQACIDGAKRIAAEQGWQNYDVEFHVKNIEAATESAHKEWCAVHSDEIMQKHYARNSDAARRLLTGDDGDDDPTEN